MTAATPPSSARPRKALHVVLVAGLYLAIWLTYRPSLEHAARSDQWNFLSDTVFQRHFKRLVLNQYAHNRTSELARGDYPLFRPVLYLLLAAEKALFGHRFVWWQAVGVAVHCAVVGLFLLLLLRFARMGSPSAGSSAAPGAAPNASFAARLNTVAAYSLALFFGVDFAVMELVIYHHLTAYMVFLLFELGVMVLVCDQLATANGRPGGMLPRVGAAFVLALLAAFTYEIGQYFAVVVGLVLGIAAWRGGRRWQGVKLMCLFGSVLLLFQLVDHVDRMFHPPLSGEIRESDILAEACKPKTLSNAGRYLAFCAVQPFFPSCVDLGFDSRLVVAEPRDNLVNYSPRHPLWVVSFLVLAFLVALTACGLRRLRRDPQGQTRLMVALLAGALVALHMSIIVFGRMNMRDWPTILSMNSYYAYLPLAMLLVGLYALWSGRPSLGDASRHNRLLGVVQLALVAGLLVLSTASARKVHAMNIEIANVHRPLRACLAFFDDLVHEHAGDQYFRLAFSAEAMDQLVAVMPLYHLPQPLPVVLHRPYLDFEHPTHVVTFTDGAWQSHPVTPSEREFFIEECRRKHEAREKERKARAGLLDRTMYFHKAR